MDGLGRAAGDGLGARSGHGCGVRRGPEPLARRDSGASLLRTWVEAPEVADVDVFALGIDHDNVASRRCAESAGFRADDDVPDWEGIVYFTRRRARP